MANKYVPSFLKTGDIPKIVSSYEDSPKKGVSFEDTPKEKPLVNTSLPAREAPKFVPATLAALTSATNTAPLTNTSLGRSYASKYTEQAKTEPTEKPIDCASQDEFPSLGISIKPKSHIAKAASLTFGSSPSNTVKLPKIRDESEVSHNKTTKGTWASMASAWAKQTEEEEAAKKEKELQDELNRKELEQLRKMMPTIKRNRRLRIQEDEGDSDADSYEVPEGDILTSDTSDDERGEEEFNQNAGWERRHHDDLY
jgi:hypothetical protein